MKRLMIVIFEKTLSAFRIFEDASNFEQISNISKNIPADDAIKFDIIFIVSLYK